jgi:hypothetical protein
MRRASRSIRVGRKAKQLGEHAGSMAARETCRSNGTGCPLRDPTLRNRDAVVLAKSMAFFWQISSPGRW